MSKVSLVGITKPSAMTGCTTAEELVAYAARVSNPENQIHHESAPRLLRYLIKHGHWSPFEMVSITMEIVTTRDIARQMLRHRSFSFQELPTSGHMIDFLINLAPNLRPKPTKNRPKRLRRLIKKASKM